MKAQKHVLPMVRSNTIFAEKVVSKNATKSDLPDLNERSILSKIGGGKLEKSKIKLEIYEGDPFGCSCCGPGPMLSSPSASEKLRLMLVERNQIVEKLAKEFKETVEMKREIISQKRSDYSEYVRKLSFDEKSLPYVFINGEIVIAGRFPTYEEFVTLLKSHLKKQAIG